MHIYFIVGEKTLESGKAYYTNIFGQIKDIEYKRMTSQRGKQLDTHLKHIESSYRGPHMK